MARNCLRHGRSRCGPVTRGLFPSVDSPNPRDHLAPAPKGGVTHDSQVTHNLLMSPPPNLWVTHGPQNPSGPYVSRAWPERKNSPNSNPSTMGTMEKRCPLQMFFQRNQILPRALRRPCEQLSFSALFRQLRTCAFVMLIGTNSLFRTSSIA